MATIGLVSGTVEKGFSGQLTTLSIRIPIEIRLNSNKNTDMQPDYRIWSDGVECGAGWLRRGQTSGKRYVSLTLEAPEFGQRPIHANLGRAAGKTIPTFTPCFGIRSNELLAPDLQVLRWNPGVRLAPDPSHH